MGEVKSPTKGKKACVYCKGTRWVDDQNWQPTYSDLPTQRRPHDGRIPCGKCNFAGWDVPDGKQSPASGVGR